MEGRRAFLIRSARGVHERAAERHECLGEELAIADIASGCDCLAHPLDAGFDRPRPEGRLACLEDGKDGGSPRDPLAGRGRVLGDGGAQRGCRVEAELSAKELRARGDVAGRGLVVAACAQAAHEQDVGVLVVGVQPDELGRTPGCGVRLAPPQVRKRGLMEDRARHAGDVPALVLEPELEAGARTEGEAVQKLVAETGESDGLHPGAALEHVEVDERPGLQSQLERVSAELRVVAQPAAESGKRPPERSERVVRLGEEEACEALARRREPRAQEVGEQAPRFVAAWGLYGSAIPFDSGRAQKVDAQAHRPPFLVTRVVTRLTVTLLPWSSNTSERKERTCA